MFISKKILFCIFLMLSSQIVLSEDVDTSTNLALQNSFVSQGINAYLATIDTIYSISVDDQVKNGCLPYPNKLKDAAEIGLRRNGFILETDETNAYLPNRAHIFIRAVGSKSRSICFANIDVKLGMYRVTEIEWAKEPADIYGDGQHVYIMVYHSLNNLVLIGPSNYIQSSMEIYAKDTMDDLFLDVSRARDDIFAKFPSIKNRYEHQKALEKAEIELKE